MPLEWNLEEKNIFFWKKKQAKRLLKISLFFCCFLSVVCYSFHTHAYSVVSNLKVIKREREHFCFFFWVGEESIFQSKQLCGIWIKKCIKLTNPITHTNLATIFHSQFFFLCNIIFYETALPFSLTDRLSECWVIWLTIIIRFIWLASSTFSEKTRITEYCSSRHQNRSLFILRILTNSMWQS